MAPTGGDAVEQHLFALAEVCAVPEFEFRPRRAVGEERTQLFFGRQPELTGALEKVEAKAVAGLEQVGDACLGGGVFLGAERTPDDEARLCDSCNLLDVFLTCGHREMLENVGARDDVKGTVREGESMRGVQDIGRRPDVCGHDVGVGTEERKLVPPPTDVEDVCRRAGEIGEYVEPLPLVRLPTCERGEARAQTILARHAVPLDESAHISTHLEPVTSGSCSKLMCDEDVSHVASRIPPCHDVVSDCGDRRTCVVAAEHLTRSSEYGA